ncbi:hypothetical protein EZS27_018498 [termite gut metagenome]|uniref:Uncharacterized protein n=1 Tax=termite gut metagenome TaxID=433724 RepID=A0A5J4RH82_9ZZZZ
MKPLTVKSTGQMSEYTKSRTGIGAAIELAIGTDGRLAIRWDGQTEKRLSVLANTQAISGAVWLVLKRLYRFNLLS